jgi:hypothetical protein
LPAAHIASLIVPETEVVSDHHHTRAQRLHEDTFHKLLRCPVGHFAREGQRQHVLDSFASHDGAPFRLRSEQTRGALRSHD